jgi:bla regulator protein BlaR1
MILKYFSGMCMAVPPALGNHLWQSTLFCAIAGLLTLMLRKNRARARYGLWLAASVKFLIPFSFLVGLGSHLPWARNSAGVKAGLYVAMEEVTQPFAKLSMPVVSRVTPQNPAILSTLTHFLPAILAMGWLCGFVLVVFVWGVRWRRISIAIREAVPLTEGREVEALRQLERMRGIRNAIPILLSRASFEPGVFGIARPALIWPKGITELLNHAQLEAILAHEVWHVRHEDNLTAAVHMVVEAIFWFYPPVWWLGARLVEERERACDEEVLEMGTQPRIYAESILKTCEFCVACPVACLSGVTGADLKKRIVRIMSGCMADRLSFGRKTVLAAIGLVVIATPVALGFVNRPSRLLAQLQHAESAAVQPFEVASIKPSRADDKMRSLFMQPGKFTTEGETVKDVISFAYGIRSDNQLSGGPSWVNSERFDIEAKEEDSVAENLQKLPIEERAKQIRLMVQALLADRFKLKVSHQTKELPVYALVVAKGGSKLTEAQVPPPSAEGTAAPKRGFRGIRMMGPGQLTGTNINIGVLADMLSRQRELGRLVIDQTGLKGNYDWTLKWTPDQGGPMFKGPDGGQPSPDAPPPDSSGPSIFTALEEQLGLKLESRKGPVETLVIDSIERPSEN